LGDYRPSFDVVIIAWPVAMIAANCDQKRRLDANKQVIAKLTLGPTTHLDTFSRDNLPP
jgi:hypothetical protein